MEKEISSGAMLGIVLIALAAIIGLGFGVFAIAKSTANDGITQVQDNLNAVGQSVYNDYDQKVITGTQVLSAYNTFEGKNTAILIMTQALKDKAVESSPEDAILAANGVSAAYGEGSDCKLAGYLVEAMTKSIDASGAITYNPVATITSSNNNAVADPVFINYNAILGADSNTNGATIEYTSGKWIAFDTNCWRTTVNLEADAGGKVIFNNITANMNKSGMMEYVSTGARFQSYLIKDASGTIVGLAFEQINAN